ncbi:2-dehydro-3-deoxy-6-phosphogalactonate aldolase [Pasteurellaceae bacterium HPA106]|uniref:2-dehydro-3-deoxy-6-phosphogalactonate aldolase n=1 Tax=Spirabiliibacterium pneumoniae TaxID=221400 RepID=UPI001AACC40D|nr:2-dehydro-3-deoxy-6-phosphogalactonate aldolase [Spirabiliibacterium pneumoniae]MBE2895922.1 2-dehydro-3-deoxy-6-phosphogalactonate aldolase [Spirabiliibacterium pneumoniae]
MQNKFELCLSTCPIIAILRGVTPQECIDVGNLLYQAGIRIIEVPLNSPSPFESIKLLKNHFKEKAIIGAGTVLSVKDVIALHEIDAEIVIAPNLDIDVGLKTKQLGMLWLPGVITPSEGFTALKYGADGLKLFPSEMISPFVIKAWKSVFPKNTKLIPVGGVNAENSKAFMQSGACALGIGGNIFKAGDTLDEIQTKTQRLIESL